MGIRQSKITKERTAADGGKLGRELLGLFTVFCGLLFILSLATFDGRDPWLNHVVSGVARTYNKAGLFGAYLAGFLYDMVGFAAWIVPVFFCIVGARRILSMPDWAWWRWIGFMLLALCLSLAGAARDLDTASVFARAPLPPGSGNVSAHGGGIVGHMLYMGMVGWLSPTGTLMIWLFSLLLSIQMITGISWLTLLASAGTFLWERVVGLAENAAEAARNRGTRASLDLDLPPSTSSEQAPLQVMRQPLGPSSADLPSVSRPGEAHTGNVPLDALGLAGASSAQNRQQGLSTLEDSPQRVASSNFTSGGHDTASAASSSQPLRLEPQEAFLSNSASPRIPAKSQVGEHINAGVERPELFRQTPASSAPGDVLSLSLSPPLLSPEEPSAASGSSLVSLPSLSTPAVQKVSESGTAFSGPRGSSFDAPLLLAPHPAPQQPFRGGDEEDLPPWVRDFEADVPGGQPGQMLAEPFRMPEPQRLDEEKGDTRSFSSLQESGISDISPMTGSRESAPAVEGVCAAPVQDNGLLSSPIVNADTEQEEKGVRALFGAEPIFSAPVAENAPLFVGQPEKNASVLSFVEPVHAVQTISPSAQIPQEEDEEEEPAQVFEARPTEPAQPASFSHHELPAGSPTREQPKDLPVPQAQTVVPSFKLEAAVPIHEAPGVVPSVSDAGPSLAARLLNAPLKLLARPARAPLPPLDLLEAAPSTGGGTPRHLLELKGKSLMTCLNDFGIQGELVGITPGPVVTMFEVRPAPGVRVSRIANLSDDLALALKAVAVRIQAPVPGTDTVGIEIPNEVRETVCLKELLGSQLFQESKSLLTLALGKDIAGLPAVADLASMPHLLVAGATGAGKSVGINSIILSLIYKARPEEVQLLLVDPKRVEMAIYADLPHLVHPVVTEMQLAKNALEWAVAEMERRYNAIAKASVRNITDYNAKVASFGDAPPPGLEDLEIMPYLVIVIDELADLMLVAAKEVETSIVRLAQLARAAGIHLILATQRPSVDVVTGLIKANFPCRISFQVTSKHDSRTILDTVGAEHLLGKGDMLFKPGGGKFRRMHGAFVSDKNVNAVVKYWRSQQKPDYQIDFSDWAPDGGGVLTGNGGGGGGDIASDPLYDEAVEFVRQQGKASISLIQRKFRIGFNKAARFVEQMEQDGIIGPADGSRPRLVIR